MTQLFLSALMRCITWGALESTVRDGVITRSGGTAGPLNIRPHYFCIGSSFLNRSRNGGGEISFDCANCCKRCVALSLKQFIPVFANTAFICLSCATKRNFAAVFPLRPSCGRVEQRAHRFIAATP